VTKLENITLPFPATYPSSAVFIGSGSRH